MTDQVNYLSETLEQWYRYFNEFLFESSMGPCIITLTRKRNARGFYHPENFKPMNGDEAINALDEIAMNPETFEGRSSKGIASTLVHEMVHKYQEMTGKPGKGGYHNKEWAQLMEGVGLQPYNVKDEGKKTGYTCSHNIDPEGEFSKVYDQMVKDFPHLEVKHAVIPKLAVTRKIRKTKYTCHCDEPQTVWGKPGLSILCPNCDRAFWEEVK